MFNWTNIFRGIAMGGIETVPGVSSSTIAMLMGIYEQLLRSLSDLTSGNWKRGLSFLIPLGIGMGFGLLIAARVIKYLLQSHPIPIHFLFVGLVLGILPFLWRSAHSETGKSFGLQHWLLIVIAFILISLTHPNIFGNSTDGIITNFDISTYAYLFIAGWIASTALVLPGISGALVLILLGVYSTALEALSSFNIPVILALGSGVLVGILITSRIIRYFLRVHTQLTYAIMLGLVAGSLIVIFPTSMPDTFLYAIVCFFTFLFGLTTALTFGKAERT